MPLLKSVVLIGAGKVATLLGKQLANIGMTVNGVWSKTEASAKKLAQQLSCSWTVDLDNVPVADFYLVMVKDDAIGVVAKRLSAHLNQNALIAHTSGAVPSTVFEGHFNHFGVFYPLQSFSENVSPDFKTIPFCVDGCNEQSMHQLLAIAQQLSSSVYRVSDTQRAYLHLAAVFTNNFTNYLQFISKKILEGQQLPYSIIQPLLDETIRKLSALDPINAQTGPAIRNDKQTMENHLALLASQPEWMKLYEQLSNGIITDMNIQTKSS